MVGIILAIIVALWVYIGFSWQALMYGKKKNGWLGMLNMLFAKMVHDLASLIIKD